MKQILLDYIRVFNKYVTNKVLIHIAGRKFGHFAILRHTGRKSGTLYRIPIIAEPLEDGFVVALTYGKQVDWYKNVRAKGSCSIYWKKKDYDLTNPEFRDKKIALAAFPAIFRSLLKIAGTEYFLKLEVQS